MSDLWIKRFLLKAKTKESNYRGFLFWLQSTLEDATAQKIHNGESPIYEIKFVLAASFEPIKAAALSYDCETIIQEAIVKSPFTLDQVNSINEYQESGTFHPFTCPHDHGGLEAAEDSLHCGQCNYTQDWVHSWMADWKWRKTLKEASGSQSG